MVGMFSMFVQVGSFSTCFMVGIFLSLSTNRYPKTVSGAIEILDRWKSQIPLDTKRNYVILLHLNQWLQPILINSAKIIPHNKLTSHRGYYFISLESDKRIHINYWGVSLRSAKRRNVQLQKWTDTRQQWSRIWTNRASTQFQVQPDEI